MSVVSPMTQVVQASDMGGAPSGAPRLLLPDPRTVFAQRARRLRDLADGHELGQWLLFCHQLSLAQDRVAASTGPLPDVDGGREGGGFLPLELSAAAWGYWQALLAEMGGGGGSVDAVCESLKRWPKAQWEAQAQALLVGDEAAVTPEATPFLGAALQLEWTLRASQLPPAVHAAYQGESAVCPVCGSHPMVSLVHTGDPNHGVRYLVCSLCQSQWHAARAKCTNCESPKEVALLGASEKAAVQGECCDACHAYVKLLSLPRDVQLDPCADDLATLGLDVMLEQAGYGRAARNLFWVG